MTFDVIGERIERALDAFTVMQVCGRNIHSREKCPAKTVRRKQAVQIAAVHATVSGNGAFARAVENGERT